jgi:glycerol-3-phosphate O-acyltransferase
MTETVAVPIWLLFLIGALATWVLLERLLLPGVRWFFRRRLNMVLEELARRLKVKLPTFSLTKRRVLIDRLTYDPKVMEEVREFCERTGTPWEVAVGRVERYAKEIVPAFNAYFYFRIGNAIARRLVQKLYRVRLAYADEAELERIDPKASIVFVINHRSNMDYVLVTYLAQKQTALSYAAGEWARVWPLQSLVKAMGAYFVRRGSNNPLYRRVLERYVQMAVEGGVVQAVFPEGGLSRDGRFREPKVGLLDYMLRPFDPKGERDIVFIPVALNYDRVIEDRNLTAEAKGRRPERRWAVQAIWTTLLVLGRRLTLQKRRRWFRLGYACASFGTPISTRQWCRRHKLDFRKLDQDNRIVATREFADHLMSRIGNVMPVTPVSLVSWILLVDPKQSWSREALHEAYEHAIERLRTSGAHPYIPRRDPIYAVEVGLRMLRLRKIVESSSDGFAVVPGELDLLSYYANAIDHLMRSA